MNILIVEHLVQELTSSTCSLFHKTLNKTAIETILNEIFTTDVNENEQVIEKFKKEYDL